MNQTTQFLSALMRGRRHILSTMDLDGPKGDQVIDDPSQCHVSDPDMTRNTYVTLNPVRPEATRRRAEDIACLAHLAIDVDTSDKTDPTLVKVATDLCSTIVDALRARHGWEPITIVHTGGGAHAIYRLDDLPLSTQFNVAAVLEALSEEFSNEQAHVDLSLSDPPQLVRIPGTTNLKTSTIAKLTHCNPDARALTLDDLITVGGNVVARPGSTPTSPSGNGHGIPCDLEGYQLADLLGDRVREVRKDGSILLKGCSLKPSKTCNLWIKPTGKVAYVRCHHHKCHGATLADVFMSYDLDPSQLHKHYPDAESAADKRLHTWIRIAGKRLMEVERVRGELQLTLAVKKAKDIKFSFGAPSIGTVEPSTFVKKSFPKFFNEAKANLYGGLSPTDPARIADGIVNQGDLISVGNALFRFDGNGYVPVTNLAGDCQQVVVAETAYQLGNYGFVLFPQPPIGKKLTADVEAHLLARVPSYREFPDERTASFANGYLTPDLVLHPHTRERIARPGAEFDFCADPPKSKVWERFLDESVGVEQRQVLLERVGALMFRDHRSRAIPCLIGKSTTGKSTLVSIIEHLLGHSQVAPIGPHMLTNQFAFESAVGANLVIMNECEVPISKSALSQLKAISGNDRVQIPRKFKSAFGGCLKAALMMVGNWLPEYKDESLSMRNRLVPIIYRKSVSKKDVDVDLLEKLIKDLPYFVWQCCLAYQHAIRQGYTDNPEARSADSTSSAPVRTFIETRCNLDKSAKCLTTALYSAFAEFCNDESVEVPTRAEFVRTLQSHFLLRQAKSNKGQQFHGISLSKTKVKVS